MALLARQAPDLRLNCTRSTKLLRFQPAKPLISDVELNRSAVEGRRETQSNRCELRGMGSAVVLKWIRAYCQDGDFTGEESPPLAVGSANLDATWPSFLRSGAQGHEPFDVVNRSSDEGPSGWQPGR